MANELELPLVITPTLASTDSPCSDVSVLYSDQGEMLSYRFYSRHPDLMHVDTTVIAQAPKRQLVAGLGFECGGLTAAHAVNNSFSMIASSQAILHGEKVAMDLHTQLVLEGQPQSEICEIFEYCRSVELPTSLAQLGVNADNDEPATTNSLKSQQQPWPALSKPPINRGAPKPN